MKFEQLIDLFRKTHKDLQSQASRSVDIALVVRNWLFGWYIVEFEQGGAGRAELYGKELINRLSNNLKQSGLNGTSPTNLRKFREFYLYYAKIQQTLPVKSGSTGTDVVVNPSTGISVVNKINGLWQNAANISTC